MRRVLGIALVSVALAACGEDAAPVGTGAPATTAPPAAEATAPSDDGAEGAAQDSAEDTDSPADGLAEGSGGEPDTDESDAGDGTDMPSSPLESSPGEQAAQDEFVRVVRSSVPEVAAGRTDAELVAVAQRACEELAAGRPADDLVEQVRSLGTLDAEATDFATARELVKLAIDTHCLDQAARVDEF